MRKLTSVIGYALAALALPVVLATFVGLSTWERALVSASGVRVSPWFTGGDVAVAVPRGPYELRVHEPVFQALCGQRDEGFVQVVVAPADSLPREVDERVDYDLDGVADFRLRLDTVADSAEVEALDAEVIGLEAVVRLDDGVAVRVGIRNPRKHREEAPAGPARAAKEDA